MKCILSLSALRLAYEAARMGKRYRLRGPNSRTGDLWGGNRVEPRTADDRARWAKAVAAQTRPLTPKMVSALAYAARYESTMDWWWPGEDGKPLPLGRGLDLTHAAVWTLRGQWWADDKQRAGGLETDAQTRGRHVSTGWPAVRRALEAKGLMTSGGKLTEAGVMLCRERLLPHLAVCAFAARLGDARR